MNRKKKIHLEGMQEAFFGVFALILFTPVNIWSILLPVYGFFILIAYLIVFYNNTLKAKDFKFSILIFIVLFTYKTLQDASLFGALFFSLAPLSFILIGECRVLKSFVFFKKIFSIIILIGSLTWAIHVVTGDNSLFFLGYIPDEHVLNQLKVLSGFQYAEYPLSTRIVYYDSSGFYRFQSVFDEPGYLGTVAALTFLAGGASFKGSQNKIIFLGGIISFSLAFYLLIFIYYLIGSVVNITRLLKIIILAFLLFFITISQPTGEEVINRYLLDRVSIENGQLKGDNRATSDLDVSVNYFFEKAPLDEKLFGLHYYKKDGSSSLMQMFVSTGYVGFGLFVFIFILLLVRYKEHLNRGTFVFIMIFFISAYQRPNIIEPGYIYIFISALLFYSDKLRILEHDVSDFNHNKI